MRRLWDIMYTSGVGSLVGSTKGGLHSMYITVIGSLGPWDWCSWELPLLYSFLSVCFLEQGGSITMADLGCTLLCQCYDVSPLSLWSVSIVICQCYDLSLLWCISFMTCQLCDVLALLCASTYVSALWHFIVMCQHCEMSLWQCQCYGMSSLWCGSVVYHCWVGAITLHYRFGSLPPPFFYFFNQFNSLVCTFQWSLH